MAGVRERKRLKYHNLVEAGRAAGYRSHLITVEVGFQGMLGESDLAAGKPVILRGKLSLTSFYTSLEPPSQGHSRSGPQGTVCPPHCRSMLPNVTIHSCNQ